MKTIHIFLCAAVAVMLGVMFLIYPLCADDHWYMGGQDGAPWSLRALASAWDQVAALWHVSTGRVGNLASALFLGFMPRPVWAAAMAGCCFGILATGPRIIGCRPLSVGAALWTAGFCFAFPWMDYMFSIIFSMNYFPALLLGLATFVMYENSYGTGRRGALAAAVVALAAAWWHEGLAVPLAGALAVYSAVRGGKLPGRAKVILGATAAGMACIAVSPAFWDSMDFREPIWNRGSAWWRMLHLIGFNCFFYLYLAAMAAALALRRYRRMLLGSRAVLARQLALLAFGVITLPIYIKYYAGPRTGIFSQMFSLAGLLSLATFVRPAEIPRRGAMAVCAAVYALCIVNIAAAINVQRRLSAETAEVDALWQSAEARERGAVFYDVTVPHAGIDFYKPSYQVLNTSYGLEGRIILPASLERFDSRHDGHSCSDTTLLLHEGMLIYRGGWDMGENRTHRPDIVITTPDGSETVSRADWYSFRDAAGVECTYVAPHAVILNPSTVIMDARRKKIP